MFISRRRRNFKPVHNRLCLNDALWCTHMNGLNLLWHRFCVLADDDTSNSTCTARLIGVEVVKTSKDIRIFGGRGAHS